jgi:NitT/TauT family transport system permease protein/taurine transport system permease protein
VSLRWELLGTWALVLAGLLGAWSVAAATLPVPDYFLPPPTAVLGALAELATKGILPTYVAESLRRIVLAGLVGLVVGVPLGLLLGISRRVADFVYPVLNFFQSISGIAWLPLILVWFGFGERTILIAVNYTVLFPLIFNALLGVRSVPPIYANALRTLGASAVEKSTLDVNKKFVVPAAAARSTAQAQESPTRTVYVAADALCEACQ